MTPFLSHTGTRKNLEAARAAGWGLLLSAAGHSWHHEDFEEVGADNGQWAERDNPGPFKEVRFLRFVDAVGDRPRWLVLPDIVCGGLASLDLSLAWLERLRGHPSILLIAVQDGMTPAMIRPFLGPRVGIFVGGSTIPPLVWKERTLSAWGDLSRETGCYLHVGRVNSERRIKLCATAGAHSIDGTSGTRFAKTIPLLDRAARTAARQLEMSRRWSPPSDRSPEGFARRCREIVQQMPGHAAHRALDLLTNDILRDLGFGAGIEIFEAAVSGWHVAGLPYPAPAHHTWIDHERSLAGLPARRVA